MKYQKHGWSHTREHDTWLRMVQRCRNPNNSRWDRYGGRGITVCDRWLNSFPYFLSDMGLRPSDKHQLDRIDNDGHYEPSNCRWATHTEQMRNRGGRRPTIRLTWNGETLTLHEWAARVGLSHKQLRNRLYKGWSHQRILTEPYHAERHSHD